MAPFFVTHIQQRFRPIRFHLALSLFEGFRFEVKLEDRSKERDKNRERGEGGGERGRERGRERGEREKGEAIGRLQEIMGVLIIIDFAHFSVKMDFKNN